MNTILIATLYKSKFSDIVPEDLPFPDFGNMRWHSSFQTTSSSPSFRRSTTEIQKILDSGQGLVVFFRTEEKKTPGLSAGGTD
jgi:hypothetical protein